jgi:hypothetical protein
LQPDQFAATQQTIYTIFHPSHHFQSLSCCHMVTTQLSMLLRTANNIVEAIFLCLLLLSVWKMKTVSWQGMMEITMLPHHGNNKNLFR